MENLKLKSILYFMTGLCLFLMTSCPIPFGGSRSLLSTLFNMDSREKSTHWTIMYYVDGDNNLEELLLKDMEELSQGLAATEYINVIALVDRIDGYSSNISILGSDFSDTRLYRIGADEIYPITGEEYFTDIGLSSIGEYNMGDAQTLKKFIEYCKKYYPADHYALIFSNHGSGVRSYSGTDPANFVKGGSGLSSGLAVFSDKSIAYDETSSNDSIYTAELTDVLDSSHSVDLLVYDACLMGLVEIAYQYHPEVAGEFSADYMVASAPNVWGYGYPYDRIFSRITSVTGETERTSTVTGTGFDEVLSNYSPADLTPELLGRIFVEEQKVDTDGRNNQVLALYDLNKVQAVVTALDAVAVDLVDDENDLDNIRGNILSYMSATDPDPIGAPHYDVYGFSQSAFNISDKKAILASAVENMVLASFGNMGGFIEGKDGLGFFFPDGDVNFIGKINGINTTKPAWFWQWWYTGESFGSSYDGGRLDFCQTFDDTDVDSWFELLQYHYNPNNPNIVEQQTDYDYFHPGRW